jgi:hypothetical protein
MNWLKKGPDLKLSEIRVPDFVFDLYYDLKERHLLPLVAVLAVAIVALPIALSHSASSGDEPEEAPVATPSSVGGEAPALAVARSTPGLRDYRRRLRDARALDPFRQQAEATEAAAAAAPDEVAPEAIEAPPAAEIVTEAPIEPVEAPIEAVPPVEAPSGSESGSPAATTEPQTRYASQTLDVRIVTVSTKEGGARASAKPQAEVRRQLPELTMLPSRETPAAIFMGTSADGKKALLLVSSDVQSLFGDGQCVIGSQTCQLLALEEGVPETFVYGPQARTYRIEILAIDQALSARPHRAPLGEPKGQGDAAGKGAPTGAGRVSTAQPR